MENHQPYHHEQYCEEWKSWYCFDCDDWSRLYCCILPSEDCINECWKRQEFLITETKQEEIPMSLPTGLSVEVRDLIFTFERSCNCCRPIKKTSYETVIFINNKGHVVTLDTTKLSDITESLRISCANLFSIIERMAEDRKHDREAILYEIQTKVVKLDVDDPPIVTAGMVRNILQILDQKSSPKIDRDSPYTPSPLEGK